MCFICISVYCLVNNWILVLQNELQQGGILWNNNFVMGCFLLLPSCQLQLMQRVSCVRVLYWYRKVFAKKPFRHLSSPCWWSCKSLCRVNALYVDFPALDMFMLPSIFSNTCTVTFRIKFSFIKTPKKYNEWQKTGNRTVSLGLLLCILVYSQCNVPWGDWTPPWLLICPPAKMHGVMGFRERIQFR